MWGWCFRVKGALCGRSHDLELASDLWRFGVVGILSQDCLSLTKGAISDGRNDGRDGAIKDDPFLKVPLQQILIKRNINEEGSGGVVQCFFLEVDDDGCANSEAQDTVTSADLRPSDCIRSGSVGVVDMMLLKSYQNMHVPFTQDAPLMTKDMHEE
ncbi:hypothetical protein Acr_13g0017110 [Actinidia rufa]|uniref:Rab3GAP catalytic subunit conserved domain-containing protein n=1 Tax=Actinidia rufa TaxID=165716 RepID=A0A7J0FNL7_9ERIC|nr:hypothetical protein Acr_13g0017110 [Actinidia rufa]